MSRARNSMSASLLAGEAASGRLEILEHHDVAVVAGVRANTPSGRARRTSPARSRKKRASVDAHPDVVHEHALRGVEGRQLHEHVAGNAGAAESAMRARPVVPEWRSSTSTRSTSRPTRGREPLGGQLVDFERERVSAHGSRSVRRAKLRRRGRTAKSCSPARPVRVWSPKTASKSSSDRCPTSVRAKRCSRSSTSASTRRSAAGSTSAATTCPASRSASPSARTASAS